MQESIPRDPLQTDEGADEADRPRLVPRSLELVCPRCAFHMPATAAFCPGCGHTMRETPRAQGSVGWFPESIAGALAYLTPIPAILFLAFQPYKKSCYVRFHSGQCLLLWAAAALMVVAIRLAGVFLFMIPTAGPLFVVLLWTLAILALAFLWLALVIKALQGEMFKLPILGEFAEQFANIV
jgi:uncharacterized membrane protein